MKGILLIGGGGHCASVADALLALNMYDEISIVQNEPMEPLLGRICVVGCDENLPQLRSEGYTDAFVTVGSIGDCSLREKLFALALQAGFVLPNIVDPSAVVSPNCQLGRGVFVGKKAVVNAQSVLGDGVIVNTGAIVEHDCKLGDFTHVATGAVLCGGVQVGVGTHIGAGAVVRQYLTLGNYAVIGMGSIVVKDVDDKVLIMGNPAHIRG